VEAAAGGGKTMLTEQDLMEMETRNREIPFQKEDVVRLIAEVRRLQGRRAMLTDDQIIHIMEKFVTTPYWQDVVELDKEIYRLQEELTICWQQKETVQRNEEYWLQVSPLLRSCQELSANLTKSLGELRGLIFCGSGARNTTSPTGQPPEEK
jgi:hypothetical protein